MQYEDWRITFQSDEAAARSAFKQFQELSKGKCLHQIQEPAPVTAMDALREAEAALEVAMARILKADPGHSICVTSEAKALVAVRAALAAPAPMLVAQSQLHAALFAARGALQHMKEGGKPTQSLLNEAIAAIDSVVVTQAAPAAVAVPDAVRDAEKLLRAEAARLARIYGSNKWYGFSAEKESYLEHLRAAAALAATPAAAPAVLPEPVAMAVVHGRKFENIALDPFFKLTEGSHKLFTEQQVRALLATGGQARADARDAIRELIAIHSAELEQNEYAYFELAHTRQTGWCAWITDHPRSMPPMPTVNPDRKVIASGHGDTPEEACSAAIAAAKPHEEPAA